jgi:hypothetical protein
MRNVGAGALMGSADWRDDLSDPVREPGGLGPARATTELLLRASLADSRIPRREFVAAAATYLVGGRTKNPSPG